INPSFTPTQSLLVYRPDNTIAVYLGTASQSVQQLEQGSPVSVIAGNQTTFTSPVPGLRWEWQLQTTMQRTVNPGFITNPPPGWRFDIADVNNPNQQQNLQQNPW